MRELVEIELFESLLELHIGDLYIDLHNEYYCSGLKLENGEVDFEFYNNDNIPKTVNVIFKDAQILKMDFLVDELEALTIDNFHRGRLEINGTLWDATDDGKMVFYLEFIEGQYFEILARKVFVDMCNSRTISL